MPEGETRLKRFIIAVALGLALALATTFAAAQPADAAVAASSASSGSPANPVEQMADDTITFIKATGWQRVDLRGFSLGGMVAQEIVLKERSLFAR